MAGGKDGTAIFIGQNRRVKSVDFAGDGDDFFLIHADTGAEDGPMLSPVIKARQRNCLAQRWDKRIMKRRRSNVKYSSSQLSLIANWISVKLMQWNRILSVYLQRMEAKDLTFSLARSEV